MRARGNNRHNIKYYVILGGAVLFQFVLFLLKDQPEWIERYYSRGFYPLFSYLSVILFSWVPFSVGDLLYFLFVLVIVGLFIGIMRSLVKKNWQKGGRYALRLLTFLCALYTLFYVNWGLNYYRLPITKHLGLDVDETHTDDYRDVLGKYIVMANTLRDQLDVKGQSRLGVRVDLQEYIRQDTVFTPLLSKTQVHAKSPLSSALVSYFTVSGYFNPFSMEAHVNQEIPNSSYPFVYVHELAHQMGVGFEDECNFIAFRLLVDHENRWYRYAAYYAAIQSLLKPLYGNKEQLERVRNMLSEKVRADFKEEYAFWQSKYGWVEQLTNLFYNQYLQHNNQPEGLARYDMMAKLIVAWEKQKRHELSAPDLGKLYAPPVVK